MNNNNPQKWALYGGAGFIGQHLASSILSRSDHDSVTLLDLFSPQAQGWRVPLQPFLENGRLSAVKADVRDYGQLQATADKFDVIVNLAAICREPGHEKEEYFETNVTGAENICRLAEDTGCKEIIFTSSIAVYGIHDRAADEHSVPQPKMPYGQSKLQAEEIHKAWAGRVDGRLSIIRPGVVFGPGERGNVSRLVSEMLKRNRAIRIHPDQVKAGIYVEELLSIMHWLRTHTPGLSGFHLVNGVTETPITFNAYGQVLAEMEHFESRPFTAPEVLLKSAAAMLTPFSRFFPAGSKVHPRRITKLTLINDIRATALMDMDYPFSWSLEAALTDWLDKGL